MTRHLTISIAICTYNGEKFLPEQLDSFLAQTRLPDEVVVCDDGSTDTTGEILENFEKAAPFPVRIVHNEQRLTYRNNFKKAMSLCQGELISFSDQDDVWMSEKLEEVEQIFRQYPSVGHVFNDGLVVDANGNSLGFSLWDVYGFSFRDTRYFPPGNLFSLKQFPAGATITANSRLIKDLWPFPELASQEWLGFAGRLVMPFVALPKKLNKYRQHERQLYGATFFYKDKYKQARMVGNTCFADNARIYKAFLQDFMSNPHITIEQDTMKQFIDRIEHLEIRGNIKGPIFKRIPFIFKEILKGRYHRHSSGWRSVARDLLI